MKHALVCWKCGEALTDVSLPLSRYRPCRACGADLYVCRMCRNEDVHRTFGCREERAEPVRDPERANFCDWFDPRPGAFAGGGTHTTLARRQLDALFGVSESGRELREEGRSTSCDPVREALERLFGGKDK